MNSCGCIPDSERVSPRTCTHASETCSDRSCNARTPDNFPKYASTK
jgi:hypothetical protein